MVRLVLLIMALLLLQPEQACAPEHTDQPRPLEVVEVSVSRGAPEPVIERRVMTITAYTDGYESTGKVPGDPAYGITASGEQTQEGRTIAAPSEYDFGTQIYIPELGRVYTVTDRGGAIKGDRLDLYIEDLDRALEFGVRDLEVYIKY
ncbi:MAG: 3D domain-containing protein [Desulfitobacterium sp.]